MAGSGNGSGKKRAGIGVLSSEKTLGHNSRGSARPGSADSCLVTELQTCPAEQNEGALCLGYGSGLHQLPDQLTDHRSSIGLFTRPLSDP